MQMDIAIVLSLSMRMHSTHVRSLSTLPYTLPLYLPLYPPSNLNFHLHARQVRLYPLRPVHPLPSPPHVHAAPPSPSPHPTRKRPIQLAPSSAFTRLRWRRWLQLDWLLQHRTPSQAAITTTTPAALRMFQGPGVNTRARPFSARPAAHFAPPSNALAVWRLSRPA